MLIDLSGVELRIPNVLYYVRIWLFTNFVVLRTARPSRLSLANRSLTTFPNTLILVLRWEWLAWFSLYAFTIPTLSHIKLGFHRNMAHSSPIGFIATHDFLKLPFLQNAFSQDFSKEELCFGCECLKLTCTR